jgi:hypothetical protein
MLKRSFQTLTNEAIATLASETIQLVKQTEETTFTSHPLFKAIDPEYQDFFPVLDKSTFSGMGVQIATLDKQRDNAYAGLHGIVKGWSRFEDDGITLGALPQHCCLFLKRLKG